MDANLSPLLGLQMLLLLSRTGHNCQLPPGAFVAKLKECLRNLVGNEEGGGQGKCSIVKKTKEGIVRQFSTNGKSILGTSSRVYNHFAHMLLSQYGLMFEMVGKCQD
ncbi:hypothetical protein OUZ56_004402 [Daphnia magna]|uniref:Secreted protein n=1 Tax=Daphnia magna TaxID=35525 RepID=A0ABQ9YPP9_9CRUS|nr:hypothetical protein OUZ56_004402 [Daphnia magna]